LGHHWLINTGQGLPTCPISLEKHMKTADKLIWTGTAIMVGSFIFGVLEVVLIALFMTSIVVIVDYLSEEKSK
jgi:hypothetical protein